MKILLVDDVESNIAVLSFLIENWFESNNIDTSQYHLDKVYNGLEALEKIKQDNYTIIFLDIMMPIMDGLEALGKIRELNIEVQPSIVMATALGDEATKKIAREKGANAYITKPISQIMINAMLERYVDKILLDKTNQSEEENIFDDDFFDFDDFDDDDSFVLDDENLKKDMMEKFNASHKKIPASVFLEDYPNLEYILEDMEDFDVSINDIIELLDAHSLQSEKAVVSELLAQYSTFLNNFIDFFELATSLSLIGNLLDRSDFTNMDNKHREFISSYLKAILEDLQDWKEHVFVVQDAVDVFYINASSLNSCIQLESYIKQNL